MEGQMEDFEALRRQREQQDPEDERWSQQKEVSQNTTQRDPTDHHIEPDKEKPQEPDFH